LINKWRWRAISSFPFFGSFGRIVFHKNYSKDLAILTNSFTFCKSFPFSSALSVLIFESTPSGLTFFIASSTLSGPKPPARITGIFAEVTIF